MATSLSGSLKAERYANFARFTTHALLPIFPAESWVLEWNRIPVGYVWTGKSDLIRFDHGYVWTWKLLNPERKKLWIQKYSDTCGRGRKLVEDWRRLSRFPTKMTLVHARPLLGIEKFSYLLCLGFVNNLTEHVTAVRAITVNLIMWGKINTQLNHSLPADVLWDSLVPHSFRPCGERIPKDVCGEANWITALPVLWIKAVCYIGNRLKEVNRLKQSKSVKMCTNLLFVLF